MTDQWRPYGAPGDDAPPSYPAYEPGRSPEPVRRRLGLLVAVAVVVLGGTAAGVTAWALGSLDGEKDTATSSTTTTVTTRIDRTEITVRGGADLFTTDGTHALREALVRETGSAQVHEVVLTQRNAVLTVPGGTGPRTLVWDGRSLTDGGPGRAERRPFDLARLDGAVVGRLCRAEPLACTAVVGHPRPSDRGAWMTVAAVDGVRFTDLRGHQP
ncbi:hypothetical protein ACJ5H2_12620 [Nocardioides sp. R1-1]|uniref:hypothetical protein n=1 Tax=Nocardioides sp. R1-1 TaxID=3383502 RepID=UPI0038D0A7B4